MGGYMGSGLQQWIYSRNPQKKMFKKQPLKSFTALPKYSRTFKLQANRKENKKLNGFITILLVFSALVLSVFTIQKFTIYSKNHQKYVVDITNKKNLETFNFLVDSGKNRLKHREVKAAYAEFILAYKLYPKNEELNKLLIETLSILCSENNKYCNHLDVMLSKQ